MLKAVLIVVIAVGAQSQPPAPSTGERQSAQNAEQPKPQETQPDVLIGTEATPAVVRIAKSQGEAAQEQADRKRDATTQRWTIGLTAAIASFTLALVYVGWKQRQTYEATLAANKVIERAYVRLFNSLPGLDFDEVMVSVGADPPRLTTRISLGVKNAGSTPAKLTYLLLQPHFGSLPDTPPYDHNLGETISASLTKEDSFNLHRTWAIRYDEYRRIDWDSWNLYIIGYVDYIDQFGIRHRVGYARKHDPRVDDPKRYLNPDGTKNADLDSKRNNLEFVVKPGYNYDRERKKGDGKDWEAPERSRTTPEG